MPPPIEALPVNTLLTSGLTIEGLSVIPAELDDTEHFERFRTQFYDDAAVIPLSEFARIAMANETQIQIKNSVCVGAYMWGQLPQKLMKLHRYFEKFIGLASYQGLLWQLILGKHGKYSSSILDNEFRLNGVIASLEKMVFIHSLDPTDSIINERLNLLNQRLLLEGRSDLACSQGVDIALAEAINCLTLKDTLEHWLHSFRLDIVTRLAKECAKKAEVASSKFSVETWEAHFVKLYRDWFKNILRTTESEDYYETWFFKGLNDNKFDLLILQSEALQNFKEAYTYKAVINEVVGRHAHLVREKVKFFFENVQAMEDASYITLKSLIGAIETLLQPFIADGTLNLYGDVFDHDQMSLNGVHVLNPNFFNYLQNTLLPQYYATVLFEKKYVVRIEHPLKRLQEKFPLDPCVSARMSADEQVEVYYYRIETGLVTASEAVAALRLKELHKLGYGREKAKEKAVESFNKINAFMAFFSELPDENPAKIPLLAFSVDLHIDFSSYQKYGCYLKQLASLDPLWLQDASSFNRVLATLDAQEVSLDNDNIGVLIDLLNSFAQNYENNYPSTVNSFFQNHEHFLNQERARLALAKHKPPTEEVLRENFDKNLGHLSDRLKSTDHSLLAQCANNSHNFQWFLQLDSRCLQSDRCLRALLSISSDGWSVAWLGLINRLVLEDEQLTLKNLHVLVIASIDELNFIAEIMPAEMIGITQKIFDKIKEFKAFFTKKQLTLLWQGGHLEKMTSEYSWFLKTRSEEEWPLLVTLDPKEFIKIKNISVDVSITKDLLALIISPKAPIAELDDAFLKTTQATRLSVRDRVLTYRYCVEEQILAIHKSSSFLSRYVWKSTELKALEAYREKLMVFSHHYTHQVAKRCYDEVFKIMALKDRIQALTGITAVQQASLLVWIDDPAVKWTEYCTVDDDCLAKFAQHPFSSVRVFNQALVLAVGNREVCNRDDLTEFLGLDNGNKAVFYAKKMVERLALQKPDHLLAYIASADFNEKIFLNSEYNLKKLTQLDGKWICSKLLPILNGFKGDWDKDQIHFLNALSQCEGFDQWDGAVTSQVINYKTVYNKLLALPKSPLALALKENPSLTKLLWEKIYLALQSKISPTTISELLQNPQLFSQLTAEHLLFMRKRESSEIVVLLKSKEKWFEPSHFANLTTIGRLKITDESLKLALKVDAVQVELTEKYQQSRSCWSKSQDSQKNMKEIAGQFSKIMNTTVLSLEQRFQLQKNLYETTLSTSEKGRLFKTNRKWALDQYYQTFFKDSISEVLVALPQGDVDRLKRCVEIFSWAQLLLEDKRPGTLSIRNIVTDFITNREKYWQTWTELCNQKDLGINHFINVLESLKNVNATQSTASLPVATPPANGSVLAIDSQLVPRPIAPTRMVYHHGMHRM